MRIPMKELLVFALVACYAGGLHSQVLVRDIPAATSGTSALCWDGSGFWCGDATANLYKISEDNGARLDTIVSPVNGSDGLAFDGTYLWTISGAASRQRIFKIDAATGQVVDSIPDPALGQAGGLTWDGQYLWVSKNFPVDEILRIDPADGSIEQSFAAFGDNPKGLAYEGGYIWNSSEDTDGDFIYRIDAATGALNWQFQLPPHESLPNRRIRGLSWVDGFLWIVAFAQNSNNNRLLQYDVSNALFPDIQLQDTTHDFGSHVVGFPVSWNLIGMNIGNANLIIDDAPFFSGAAFNLTAPPGFPVTVTPLQSFLMTIQFAPLAAGTFVDTLFIQSNDPDEEVYPVVVRGVGLANEGEIDVVPASINFGTVWLPHVDLSSSRTVEIHNLGSGVLTVPAIGIEDGDYFFIEASSLPMEIDSHAFGTFRVWFDPQEAGTFGGTLRILSDDPNEPIVDVPLSGSAQLADFDVGDAMWVYQDFTNETDHGIRALNWIRDVNGDETPDVLAAGQSGLLYCLNGRSSGLADTFWTFNSRVDPQHSGALYYQRALSSIADLTGDGVDDVLIGTAWGSRSIYALSGVTGEQLWMFDTRFWGDGGWVGDVEAIPDINGDDIQDVIVAAAGDGGSGGVRRVFALNGQNGQFIWEGPAYESFYTCALINDVTSDGVRDVVGGGTSWVVGINGINGTQRFLTSIGNGSPVFDMEPMGFANPEVNQSEDIVVASAYRGVYVIDGGNGSQLWFRPFDATNVYEVAAGSDITEDGVRDIYVGTVSGHLVCLDGRTGGEIWDIIPDPLDPSYVRSIEIVPDITADGNDDVVCGTLGDHLVVVDGLEGNIIFATMGNGTSAQVDVVGVMPDVDGNDQWEILMGNREGMVECYSGGGDYPESASPDRPSPFEFALHPAYPNPFNSQVQLSYTIPGHLHVTAKVFDIVGRVVATLVNADLPAGIHGLNWEGISSAGAQVGTGIYLIQLSAGDRVATQKVVLLK